MTISGPIGTLLEMAALNNGFDCELPAIDGWLAFESSHVPLEIWLRGHGDADYLVALSQMKISRALTEVGEPMRVQLPEGAVAARLITNLPSMHHFLRRAFQLSRTLPDELLHSFEKKTSAFPRATEAERLIVQRVGQDIFREGLLDYWEGRCAITGFSIPELLRASHIKPWAACDTDAERLDVFNGFLLAPQLDVAFDRGFITVADDGAVVVSPRVDPPNTQILGLGSELQIRRLAEGHRTFLQWHRERLFKR